MKRTHRTSQSILARLAVAAVTPIAAGIALISVSACHKSSATQVFMDTAVVSRQSITITASATGTIEPAEVVQVKSKASGEIMKMPVTMGTIVKAGDLIAEIDPRDPKARYDQAVAGLNAAKASVSVTKVQLTRADTLFAQRALTADEHETAVLAYANAQSGLATAATNLEVAQTALADVTLRAPSAGTIIDKEVSEGQVIASATNSVSGGTVLVTLANLQNIVDSALVTETDIGKIRVGEPASVTVDAYPNQTFHGTVDKVSPEAVTLQSVTMFPVIIKLDNSAGLLKPGMNSDVSILVDNETNVLVIPNDAIGSDQDVAQAEVALNVAQPAGSGGTAAKTGKKGGGRRGAGAQTSVASTTPATGTTPSTGTTTATAPTATTPAAGRGRSVDSAGGAIAMATGGSVPNAGAATNPAAHAATVLVLQGGKWVPRNVILGTANYDVTEVISGLTEGDKVALVSEIRVQASRDSSLSRIQSRGGLAGVVGGGSRGGGGGARGGASRGGGR